MSKSHKIRKKDRKTELKKETLIEPFQSKSYINNPLHFKSLLILIGISIAIYSNSLMNGFVYDDARTIIDNKFIKDLENLPKLFNKGYFLNEGEISYRPMVTLSYFLDYAIYGLKPWGYHLSNLILHTANTVLLYIFLILIFEQTGIKDRAIGIVGRILKPPFLISLVFVTHPVLTEAVNAISYREDLLAFFFYFAALNLYLLLKSNTFNIRKPSYYLLYALSCMLYFLGLLSKEMAITLPLIIYCYEWIYRDKNKDVISLLINRLNLGYIAVTLLYIFLRFFIFYNPIEGERPALPLTERLLAIPWLLSSYIKLTVFPVSLSAEYMPAPIKSTFFDLLVPSIIILIFSFTLKRREMIFGFFFFLSTLIPTYNIIPTANPLAERTLYLPVTGFAVIAGLSIHMLLDVQKPIFNKTRRSYTSAFFISIIGLHSFNVLSRNGVWHDNISLFSDTAGKMPNSSRIHYSLGCAYLGMGKVQEAKKEFLATLELSPNYLEAHANLGIVYYKQRSFEEAIMEFNSVLKIKPDHANTYNNLAQIYSDIGRIDEAIHLYQTALGINPNLIESHYGLGLAYMRIGLKDAARKELEMTLRLRPDHMNARRVIESIDK